MSFEDNSYLLKTGGGSFDDQGFISAPPSAPAWSHEHGAEPGLPQTQHSFFPTIPISEVQSDSAPQQDQRKMSWAQPTVFLRPSSVAQQPPPPACAICTVKFGVGKWSYKCTCCGGMVCHPCSNRTMHPIFPAAKEDKEDSQVMIAFDPKASSSAVRTCKNCESHWAQGHSVCIRRITLTLATEGCPVDTSETGLPERVLSSLLGLTDAAEYAASCAARFKGVSQGWEGDRAQVLANGNYTDSRSGKVVRIPAEVLEGVRHDGQEASEFLRAIDESGGIGTLVSLIATVVSQQIPALGVSDARDSDEDEYDGHRSAGVSDGSASGVGNGWEEALLYLASSQRLEVDDRWCFPCPEAMFKSQGIQPREPCTKPCCHRPGEAGEVSKTEDAEFGKDKKPAKGSSTGLFRPRLGSGDASASQPTDGAAVGAGAGGSGRSSRASSLDGSLAVGIASGATPREIAQRAQFDSIKQSIEARDSVARLRTTLHDVFYPELAAMPTTDSSDASKKAYNGNGQDRKAEAVAVAVPPSNYAPSASAVVGAASPFAVNPSAWPWASTATSWAPPSSTQGSIQALPPTHGKATSGPAPVKRKGSDEDGSEGNGSSDREGPRLRVPKASYSRLLKCHHATVLAGQIAACRLLCALAQLSLCSHALVRGGSPAEKRWSPYAFYTLAAAATQSATDAPHSGTPPVPGFDLGKALTKMLQRYNGSGVAQEAFQQWQYAIITQPPGSTTGSHGASYAAQAQMPSLSPVQAAKGVVAARLVYWLQATRALSCLLTFRDDYLHHQQGPTQEQLAKNAAANTAAGRERSSSAGLYPAMGATSPFSVAAAAPSIMPQQPWGSVPGNNTEATVAAIAAADKELSTLTVRLQHAVLKAQGLSLLTTMLVEAQQFADISSSQTVSTSNTSSAAPAQARKMLADWAKYGLCAAGKTNSGDAESGLVGDCFYFLPSILLHLLVKVQPQPSLDAVKDEKSLKSVLTRSAKAYDATLLQSIKEQLMGLGGSASGSISGDGVVKAQALGSITTKAAGTLEQLVSTMLLPGLPSADDGENTSVNDAALRSATHRFMRAFAAVSSLVDGLQAVAVSNASAPGGAPQCPAFYALQSAAIRELLAVKSGPSASPSSGSAAAGWSTSPPGIATSGPEPERLPSESDPLCLVLTILVDEDVRRLFERGAAGAASSSPFNTSTSHHLIGTLYTDCLNLLRLALSLPLPVTTGGASSASVSCPLQEALRWPHWPHICRLLDLLVSPSETTREALPFAAGAQLPAVMLQLLDTLTCAVSAAAAAAGNRDGTNESVFGTSASEFSLSLLGCGLLTTLTTLTANTIVSPHDPTLALAKRQRMCDETSDDHQLLMTAAKLAQSLLICAQWEVSLLSGPGHEDTRPASKEEGSEDDDKLELALRLASTQSAGASSSDDGDDDDGDGAGKNTTLLYEWVSYGRASLAAAVEFALAATDLQQHLQQSGGPLQFPSSITGSPSWSACVKQLSISAAFYQATGAALSHLQRIAGERQAGNGGGFDDRHRLMQVGAQEALAACGRSFFQDGTSGLSFSLHWLSSSRDLLRLLGVTIAEGDEAADALDDRLIAHRSGCKHAGSAVGNSHSSSVLPTCSCRELRLRHGIKTALTAMGRWVEIALSPAAAHYQQSKNAGTVVSQLATVILSVKEESASNSSLAASVGRALAGILEGATVAAEEGQPKAGKELLSLLKPLQEGDALQGLAARRGGAVTAELLLRAVSAVTAANLSKEDEQVASSALLQVLKGADSSLGSSGAPQAEKLCEVFSLLLHCSSIGMLKHAPAGESTSATGSTGKQANKAQQETETLLQSLLVRCILLEAATAPTETGLSTLELLARCLSLPDDNDRDDRAAHSLLLQIVQSPHTQVLSGMVKKQACYRAASDAITALAAHTCIDNKADTPQLLALAKQCASSLVSTAKECLFTMPAGQQRALESQEEEFMRVCSEVLMQCCDTAAEAGAGGAEQPFLTQLLRGNEGHTATDLMAALLLLFAKQAVFQQQADAALPEDTALHACVRLLAFFNQLYASAPPVPLPATNTWQAWAVSCQSAYPSLLPDFLSSLVRLLEWSKDGDTELAHVAMDACLEALTTFSHSFAESDAVRIAAAAASIAQPALGATSALSPLVSLVTLLTMMVARPAEITRPRVTLLREILKTIVYSLLPPTPSLLYDALWTTKAFAATGGGAIDTATTAATTVASRLSALRGQPSQPSKPAVQPGKGGYASSSPVVITSGRGRVCNGTHHAASAGKPASQLAAQLRQDIASSLATAAGPAAGAPDESDGEDAGDQRSPPAWRLLMDGDATSADIALSLLFFALEADASGTVAGLGLGTLSNMLAQQLCKEPEAPATPFDEDEGENELLELLFLRALEVEQGRHQSLSKTESSEVQGRRSNSLAALMDLSVGATFGAANSVGESYGAMKARLMEAVDTASQVSIAARKHEAMKTQAAPTPSTTAFQALHELCKRRLLALQSASPGPTDDCCPGCNTDLLLKALGLLKVASATAGATEQNAVALLARSLVETSVAALRTQAPAMHSKAPTDTLMLHAALLAAAFPLLQAGSSGTGAPGGLPTSPLEEGFMFSQGAAAFSRESQGHANSNSSHDAALYHRALRSILSTVPMLLASSTPLVIAPLPSTRAPPPQAPEPVQVEPTLQPTPVVTRTTSAPPGALLPLSKPVELQPPVPPIAVTKPKDGSGGGLLQNRLKAALGPSTPAFPWSKEAGANTPLATPSRRNSAQQQEPSQPAAQATQVAPTAAPSSVPKSAPTSSKGPRLPEAKTSQGGSNGLALGIDLLCCVVQAAAVLANCSNADDKDTAATITTCLSVLLKEPGPSLDCEGPVKAAALFTALLLINTGHGVCAGSLDTLLSDLAFGEMDTTKTTASRTTSVPLQLVRGAALSRLMKL